MRRVSLRRHDGKGTCPDLSGTCYKGGAGCRGQARDEISLLRHGSGTARVSCGKRTVMRQSVFRIGLSVFALWFCALPVVRAQDIEMAQAAQNPPPARTPPRTPAAAHATPAPAVHAGENVRAQSAAEANGSPAAQAPAPSQIPARTEILNFENWSVTCNEFADAPRAKRCSALLQILQQNTNQVVFTWTVAMDEHKQLVAIMQTPTGVVIPPGVELKVGKSPAQKIPFASCDPGRCVATAPVDANLVREMTTSPTAEAIIQGSQGNTVQFNIQMRGFDRAYAVLSR
jgi:invasion protein IalB